jgi:hypothetical protein
MLAQRTVVNATSMLRSNRGCRLVPLGAGPTLGKFFPALIFL